MREERKKGKKKGIYTILMLICAVVFLFALYKVVDILMEYKQIDDFYDGAQEEYVDLDSHGRVNDILLSSLIAENSDVNEEYRNDHSHVYIKLPDGTWNVYEIFAMYTAGIEDGTFVVFDENQTEYDNYLALIQEKNVYQSTQQPSDGERILTLSTCTEDSDDYKRNVIQAKFVENVEKITY